MNSDYQNEDLDFQFEEAQTGGPNKRKPKRQPRFLRFVLTVFWVAVCVGVSIFMAYFALSSASDLLGINQVDQQIEIVIPDEAEGSISKVSKILSQADVIDQRVTFEIYAKFRHMDGSDRGENKAPRKFLAGTYVVNSRWDYDRLMRHLSLKDETTDIVQVVFSEGMTVAQMAQRLEENSVCSQKDFFKALDDSYDYEFLNKIPEDERFRRLEGYLFPDTYEFYVDMNPHAVVDKFLQNFQYRMDEELMSQMKDLPNGLGEMDNLITLASIIQKEAGSFEEMARVSAVFHNRLENSDMYPHLQSDATNSYNEESIRPFVDKENKELAAAYDTFEVTGLPIGPICNPGLDAIKAAINPDPTITGYFFVSDKANNYYYADTYEQHMQNIAKANAVNKQLKDAE